MSAAPQQHVPQAHGMDDVASAYLTPAASVSGSELAVACSSAGVAARSRGGTRDDAAPSAGATGDTKWIQWGTAVPRGHGRGRGRRSAFDALGARAAAAGALPLRVMWASLPAVSKALALLVVAEAAAWAVGTAAGAGTVRTADFLTPISAPSTRAGSRASAFVMQHAPTPSMIAAPLRSQECSWRGRRSGGGAAACSVEHWQAMGAVLVAQVGAACLTVCSVAGENAQQLVAGAVLSAVAGAIWIIFEVGAPCRLADGVGPEVQETVFQEFLAATCTACWQQ
jgi:hypothetical protein